MNEIHKQVQRIAELREKINLETELLNRSLAIQELWPEVFEIEGENKVRSQIGGKSHSCRYDFTIIAANGESRVFPIEEVPEILWPNSWFADRGPLARKTTAERICLRRDKN